MNEFIANVNIKLNKLIQLFYKQVDLTNHFD
jgi:hypothetical protein